MKNTLYLKDNRIKIRFSNGNERDITTYCIQLVQDWFKANNFHVTKGLDTEGNLEGLLFTEKQEVIDFVEEYYGIKKEDYQNTDSEEERKYINYITPSFED